MACLAKNTSKLQRLSKLHLVYVKVMFAFGWLNVGQMTIFLHTLFLRLIIDRTDILNRINYYRIFVKEREKRREV